MPQHSLLLILKFNLQAIHKTQDSKPTGSLYLPLGEVEPGSFQTMGVGLMPIRPRLLNAVRQDRRAVPPCTRRGEVLLIAGSTVASASRPSSMSSTAWDFSPSELTPASQIYNSTITNFLFETSANTHTKAYSLSN